MSKRDFQNEMNKVAESSANLLVDNILRKHNVKLDKNRLSASQKQHLRKLVKDLQATAERLQREYKKEEKNK
ncbi:hypothetical protein ACWE42_03080 [Sutcliffiella cohnii]